MNKILKNATWILLAVAVLSGYFFYQHIQKKNRQKVEMPSVIEGCLTVIKRSSQMTINFEGDYSERESHFRDSIQRYIKINNGLEFSESVEAMHLCPGLVDSWIIHERAIYDIFRNLNSERMRDISVIKDFKEYQWRKETINKALESMNYFKNPTAVAREVLFDRVSKSSVDDRVKQEFFRQINTVFVEEKTMDFMVATTFKRFANKLNDFNEYLYLHREKFDINNGQLIFNDRSSLAEFEKIANELQRVAGELKKSLDNNK